jgi:preprotein translocase subunit SecF
MIEDLPFDPNSEEFKLLQAQDIEKVELQLMQSTAGKFYRYRGPRDENLNDMLEELDQLLTPGSKPVEVVKALNRRVDNWFEKKNCCNEHLGPVTLSKDTIFLLIASLTITIYICVRFQVVQGISSKS